MRVATDGLATVTVVGEELGLVADADLSQLDAGLKLTGHLPNEFAEIDTHFREVVEDDPLTSEEPFDVDELHRQLQAIGEPLRRVQLFAALS